MVAARRAIESIGAGAAPAGVTVVDVRGRYVVPGLIDAHVHIANLRALRTALESGVTTVRSAGVSSYVDVGMRELVKQGAVVGPDVLAAGYHVRPTIAEEAFFDHAGARADLMRGGVDHDRRDAAGRAGQPLARRRLDQGARHRARRHARHRSAQAGLYRRGTARDRRRGRDARTSRSQAHAHGAEGALAAVKAGVRSIEHGTYLTDETLQLMVKQGTFFDPTMEAMKDVADVGGDYDNRDLQLRGQHMLPRLQGHDRARAQAGREDRRRVGHRLWTGERRPRVDRDRESGRVPA